ncbi:hypothetical protein BBJ28_00011718 [Nothophytophthora sp. Chile5]|nr:hypothetical protein BBJ28_00011718 [Nothophytophthora sp. Chile5]
MDDSSSSSAAPPRLPRPLALAITDAARRRLAGPLTATAMAAVADAHSKAAACVKDEAAAAVCAPVDQPAVRLDDLLCSICFDILSFPVTLPCGYEGVPGREHCREDCGWVLMIGLLARFMRRHNFDRGCILTAWEYESRAGVPAAGGPQRQPVSPPRRPQRVNWANAPAQNVEEAEQAARVAGLVAAAAAQGDGSGGGSGHLCPLCRQQAGIHYVEELQVNLLLKELIASLYPVETKGAATSAKKQCPMRLASPSASTRSTAGTLTTNTAATAFRRRPSLRTFSSFVYVCVASVTDPPGFVLAVLLLLALVATACSPQPASAPPAASAMLMFDTMDRVCNGLSLLIHHISLRLDEMEQLSSWIRLFSFIV